MKYTREDKLEIARIIGKVSAYIILNIIGFALIWTYGSWQLVLGVILVTGNTLKDK